MFALPFAVGPPPKMIRKMVGGGKEEDAARKLPWMRDKSLDLTTKLGQEFYGQARVARNTVGMTAGGEVWSVYWGSQIEGVRRQLNEGNKAAARSMIANLQGVAALGGLSTRDADAIHESLSASRFSNRFSPNPRPSSVIESETLRQRNQRSQRIGIAFGANVYWGLGYLVREPWYGSTSRLSAVARAAGAALQ